MARRLSTRERDVVQRTIVHLLSGRRLEVQRPDRRFVVYMGSTDTPRRDPFWYEHPGGRTYKETPEEVVRAVLPHVGIDALDRARVFKD